MKPIADVAAADPVPEVVNLAQLLESLRAINLENEEPPVKIAPSYVQSKHIGDLPIEILQDVILHRVVTEDLVSMEQFGQCCKQFYMYSRVPRLWRQAATHYLQTQVRRSSQEDERALFLSQPRIRMDGVYISRCMYTRQGLSESTYNQPIHLVTYYRYFRFYRDGTVLSLLSLHEPHQVVARMTLAHFALQKPVQSRQQ